MTDRLHFVVVCGYGCNIDSPLTPYLDRVGSFIRENRPGLTILSGGHTQQQSFPELSEAGVMYGYLRMLDFPMRSILQEDAYTTHDNIRLAAQEISRVRDRQTSHFGGRTDVKFQITIFCETQRALKVIMLSRHFMADLVDDIDDIRVETYNWERTNPERELKTTFLTWLAIKFPALARRESARKRALSKNR